MTKVELKPISSGQIMKTIYGRRKWLVEDVLLENSITIFSGAPNCGKTWAALDLAINLASGTPYLGKFAVPEKKKVLVMDRDNYAGDIKERLQSLQAPENAIEFLFNDWLYLDKEEHVEQLLALLVKENFELVIFDTFNLFYTCDENSSKDMSAVLRYLKRIVAANVSVLLLHHHRKESASSYATGNSLRGSSAIFGGIDAMYMLELKSSVDVLVFKQAKMRRAPKLEPFEVVIEKEGKKITGLRFVGKYDVAQEKRDRCKEAVTMVLNNKEQIATGEFVSFKRIMELLDAQYAPATVRDSLAQLVEEGKVASETRAHGEIFYQSAERYNEDMEF